MYYRYVRGKVAENHDIISDLIPNRDTHCHPSTTLQPTSEVLTHVLPDLDQPANSHPPNDNNNMTLTPQTLPTYPQPSTTLSTKKKIQYILS